MIASFTWIPQWCKKSLKTHMVTHWKSRRFIKEKIILVTCFLEKLIIRPSSNKTNKESSKLFKRIQDGIYEPIHPLYGSFDCFLVFIDASNILLHVCLIITKCDICKILNSSSYITITVLWIYYLELY